VKRWGLGIIGVGVVALAAAAVVVLGASDDDEDGVVLLPASARRDRAFFDDLLVDDDVEVEAGEPSGDGFRPLDDPVALAGIGVRGTTEGLYAGRRDQPLCDVERLAEVLLEADDARADAWFAAQGGRAEDREDYVGDLTPVQLRYDTRVDGHDLVDGEAERFPAVLQAGTAVLVDRFGIPRLRCLGGMPLVAPEPAPDLTAANGDDAWDGFDESQVVVVELGPEADGFDLHDAASGELFARRVGSNGDRDGNHRPSQPAQPDRCGECHELDVTMTLPDGVQARIERLTGTTPESEATEDGLHWRGGQAPPGLYRIEVTNLNYVHHYIEEAAELANWFLFDDPRYADEEVTLGAGDVTQPGALPELRICVPGEVTTTVTVDGEVAQTFTDRLGCGGDSSKTYEFTI